MNLGEIQVSLDHKKVTDELYYCAAQCMHCHDACRMENKPELEHCMVLDQDCADICRLAGQWLERNSPATATLLKACADVCIACAEACEKHQDMEHCRHCAEVCWKCAELCHVSLVA